MIDWSQLSYYIASVCGALLCAIAIYYIRRVDKHDDVCSKLTAAIAIMETLVEKHDTRLDAVDLSIIHIREFAHDTRGLLPSNFEKTEIDRRRTETTDNFKRLFQMLDEMKTERYQFQSRIMEMLATKQDKTR